MVRNPDAVAYLGDWQVVWGFKNLTAGVYDVEATHDLVTWTKIGVHTQRGNGHASEGTDPSQGFIRLVKTA